jgi:hypothetical protein
MDAWDMEMQSDFSHGGRGQRVVERVKSQISTGQFQPIAERKAHGNE